MSAVDLALNLIRQFEGCHLQAYKDPGSADGLPITIGWGSTRDIDFQPFTLGQTISREMADRLLHRDVSVAGVRTLEQLIPDWGKMTPPMQAALLSFSYNCGWNFYGALGFRSLTAALKTRNWHQVPDALLLYVNPGTRVEPGLRRRRQAEGKLWREGLTNPEVPGVIKLPDFFRYYKPDNPNHQKAVELLQKAMPAELLSDAAPWVQTYRTPQSSGTSGQDIDLAVPYYSQRDNAVEAFRTCFSSSCAMLLKTLRPKALPDTPNADDLYINQVYRIGSTTSPDTQVRSLEHFGLRSVFTNKGGFEELDRYLENGIPVPIGILHQGLADNPCGGGHWICVKGRKSDPNAPGGVWYICNDPWGELNHQSGTYVSHIGKNMRYSIELLRARWTVEGANTGWAILAQK